MVCLLSVPAALGPVVLAAHTIVKQICDFAMAIFGTFSTVAQSLVATCLGKVHPELRAQNPKIKNPTWKL